MINEEIKELFLKDLGKRIQRIRKQKNISQEELSEKCCADRRKVGGTERGEFEFRISSIMVLANALDTNVENFLNQLKSGIKLYLKEYDENGNKIDFAPTCHLF